MCGLNYFTIIHQLISKTVKFYQWFSYRKLKFQCARNQQIVMCYHGIESQTYCRIAKNILMKFITKINVRILS